MKMVNIVYCIDIYFGKSGRGASNSLRRLILSNPNLGSYKFFCKRYIEGDLKDIEPTVGTGKDVVKEFLHGDYQCIHWVRSDGFELYAEIIHEIKQKKLNIPIISTICQQPTTPGLFLTPIELKYPSCIIFIDNTAFNNKTVTFIPEFRRKMIRFGGWTQEHINLCDTILNKNSKANKEVIIYGRGGTLNKCNKNMFEVFDGIAPPKKFIIVGSGSDTQKKWIRDEIEKRKDYEIVLLDEMPYKDWLDVVASFDIFLYHLPKDAYSSTDGTMKSAMWLKKPVVYYGPDAPKEVLIDGYNSRIAHSEDELVDSCNELAKNVNERIRLGENARRKCESLQSYKQFLEKVNQQYEEVKALPPLRLSFLYLYTYALYMYKRDKSWPMKVIKSPLDKLRVNMAIRTRCKKILDHK